MQRQHGGFGIGGEDIGLRRHLGAAPAAIEQTDAEDLFKLFDGFGNRGLGNGEGHGGFLQRCMLGHGQKALQMPEFDTTVDHGFIHNFRLYVSEESITLHNFFQ